MERTKQVTVKFPIFSENCKKCRNRFTCFTLPVVEEICGCGLGGSSTVQMGIPSGIHKECISVTPRKNAVALRFFRIGKEYALEVTVEYPLF